MKDFFELYDILIDGIDTEAVVTSVLMGNCWTAVETADSFGMAMTTPMDTAPRMLDGDYYRMPLKELAAAAKSWNLTEAGFGMAAINAFYNTPTQLERLGAYEPFDNYCTDGLDLRGKRIGVIGSAFKAAGVHKTLKEEYGLLDEELDLVTTPIGLNIKGETPAEIAISIAAQMILHRAERNGL